MPSSTAHRFDDVEISLIRQINALATPLSLNLGIGEPNIEPDEAFREMAARAIREDSWHYTANAGTLELRSAIAAMMGGTVDPRTGVCVTAGTEEALFAIMQAFVEPGDEVLIPNPGFVAYGTLARLAGAQVLTYQLDPDRWAIDFESLERAVSPRTKLVIVNSPSNPTGGVIDDVALTRLAALADERDFLVVSDEVYREIHYGSRPPTLWGKSDNAVVVNGLSKSHSMTGLRLGWAVAPERLMGPIIKAHQYIATCASSVAQRLAGMVLSDHAWNDDWLRRMRQRFEEQRDAAVFAAAHELDTSLPAPAGAFYLFVPVPRCNSLELARSLATDAAILTIPGIAFGSAGEGFLRISYAAPIETITSGIERIGRFLREPAPGT